MFKNENLKKRYVSFGVLAFAIAIVAVIFAFSSKKVDTESFAKDSETKVVKKVTKTTSTSSTAKKEEKPSSSSSKSSSSTEAKVAESNPEQSVPASDQTAAAPAQEATQAAPVAQAPAQQAPAQQYAAPASGYLANGNSAGVVGSQAAAQMAAATGVPQSTWEAIIARESNGNPNVSNASGASGLFQTMPGWGSTATVQDQINAATKAYNAQGLSAWGY
ncbi:transglycosylase [Streptococcus bovimastitidis]|uniref:Transglycosylase n=1 Tax=Streptococcus bovimastitidis TaxID=1856638 RepID=A0A1L8MMM5_9STRE|nr:transglycosylase SLT domain-containing protein [Streptococcus bovimastitidis]OJF71915.1 transglycosylase [Streptococcus bovimastitidis]